MFGEDSLPESNIIFDDFNLTDKANEAEYNLTQRLTPLGYGSHYISNIMGSIYIFMLATIIGLFLILLFSVFRFGRRFQKKLENFFLWNWVIRLVMEACLELSFAIILNWPFLPYMTTATTFFQTIDYLITIIVAILLGALPLFIVVFYCGNFRKLGDEDFEGRWGSVYEGMKTCERASLAYNVIFVLRRMLLAATCLFLYKSLWLQILISIYATQFTACYLVHF